MIQPCRLISDPNIYRFAWLGYSGDVVGAVAGVLIAGYWLRDRTNLVLAELYLPGGRYWYSSGWNWRAVIATVLGAVLAVGGAYGGPFPADGLIPFLKPLYDYSWVVGLVASLLTFAVLSRPAGRPEPAATPQTATA